MHPYATDSGERRLLPLLIVGLSILLAWALHWGLSAVDVTPPWWIDAPSVAGFYGLIYTSFNKSLWRTTPMRKIGLVKVPDINGTWTGSVHPSGGAYAYEHPATVEIAQNWRGICIRLRTNGSRSHSVIGAVIAEEAGGAVITYEYVNEPNAHAIEGMHMHRGMARLVLTGDGQVLEGEYYTGRDRKSHGTLRLERSDSGIRGSSGEQ